MTINDTPQAFQPPTCPRHRDTIAYVRCQRCDQPTCPQCQVPSDVGIHCVDCAHQAARQRRPVRPSMGQALVGQTSWRDIPVTSAIIAACVVVYVVQLPRLFPVNVTFGFVPALALVQPWRFVTTAFVHGGIMHLLFNMWAMWVMGSIMEKMLGPARYAALFILSVLGGSTLVYLLASPLSTSWWTLTVGASGGVFGLFAALFIVMRRLGRDTSGILTLIAINIAISFIGVNISWQGHIGGLLAGVAVGAVYAYAPAAQRQRRAVLGSIGVAVVLGALIALKAMLLGG